MQLDNFYAMVEELEGQKPSYGPNRTLLWLRVFEQFDWETAQLFSYLGYNASQYQLSYTNLDVFLDQIGRPPTVKVKEVK